MATKRAYRVGPLADIPTDTFLRVRAGGEDIGLLRLEGRVVAYRNRCCHQGGPVCAGEVLGRYEEILDAAKRTLGYRLSERELRIVCPWHGWEYDVATGQCAADRRFRLKRFDVDIRDGVVYVIV